MKRARGYSLQRIAGTDYLLPFGQFIADHRLGISLNDTGVYIWNLLENEMSREELQEKYLKEFLDDPEQKEDMIADLKLFLDQLISYKIIESSATERIHYGETGAVLDIGGIILKLHCPKELLEFGELKEFCTETDSPADMEISVISGASFLPTGGTVLVKNSELTVYEQDDEFVLFFPTFPLINEVRISKDGSSAFFYCTPPLTELGEPFYHAMRHVFLYLAKMRGMHAIHSASILYRGKAWLFSGVSGTGKSTHTNLWNKLFETEVINGDLNLLAIEDGKPVIHGIPWCGTSGIFNKKTIPLGGIIFLKQAPTDSITELPTDKKALYIVQRFISPMWTAEQLGQSVRFAEELSQKIFICQLKCTKNDSAAELMKSRIDEESAV